MVSGKTSTLTFRIEPRLKNALRIAAERENRSIANMLEVLIRDHCDRSGIEIVGISKLAATRGPECTKRIPDEPPRRTRVATVAARKS